MRIYKEDNESVPVPIQYFLDEGEYDQGDVALVSYDALYDFIKSITVENAPKPIIKPLKRWKPNEKNIQNKQRRSKCRPNQSYHQR